MKNYLIKMEVVVTEESPHLAQELLQKRLHPWAKLVQATDPREVEQVWQDKKEVR